MWRTSGLNQRLRQLLTLLRPETGVGAAAGHMGNAIVRIRSADPGFWAQEGEQLAQPLLNARQPAH